MDDNAIIQTDGTVIAGLLIPLTVVYILAPRSKAEVVGEITSTVSRIALVIILIVLPFSVSAIL